MGRELIRDLFGKRRPSHRRFDVVEADVIYSVEKRKGEYPHLEQMHAETNGRGEPYWIALHAEVNKIQQQEHEAFMSKKG